MNARRAIVVATAVLLLAPVARSGHELPVYPSYYPHEIELTAMAPERAAELMRAGKLHAYVGAMPTLAGAKPDAIGTVESLGSWVVARLNPAAAPAAGEGFGCGVAAMIVRGLARGGEVTLHPYPVTPLHGDYLAHADRAEVARGRLLATPPMLGSLRVRAASAEARRFVRPDWLADGERWEASVEVVDVARLVGEATLTVNGWMGPRWARSGWFHAYRLLADALVDPAQKEQAAALVARLQGGDYAGAVERINLERELVGLLTGSCRAVVAGYTSKREHFNAEFSAGIENIGYDALEGLRSPMFLRTVKLKDFPWNGWLQLGLDARPTAAWNPIGGLNDEFGRMMWFAVGDPAAIPSPYEAGWVLNRISDVEAAPRP